TGGSVTLELSCGTTGGGVSGTWAASHGAATRTSPAVTRTAYTVVLRTLPFPPPGTRPGAWVFPRPGAGPMGPPGPIDPKGPTSPIPPPASPEPLPVLQPGLSPIQLGRVFLLVLDHLGGHGVAQVDAEDVAQVEQVPGDVRDLVGDGLALLRVVGDVPRRFR